MLVKSIAPEKTIETAGQAMVAVLAPPRWNFARVCLWCGVRDCVNPECIDGHARSAWAVCSQCDGFGTLVSCTWCCSGVVEMADVPTGDRQLASSVDEYETAQARRRAAKLPSSDRHHVASYQAVVDAMPSYLVAR